MGEIIKEITIKGYKSIRDLETFNSATSMC